MALGKAVVSEEGRALGLRGGVANLINVLLTAAPAAAAAPAAGGAGDTAEALAAACNACCWRTDGVGEDAAAGRVGDVAVAAGVAGVAAADMSHNAEVD
jgi:hypothetical protein